MYFLFLSFFVTQTDDTVDVTSEPDEQDLSMSSSSSLTQTKSQQQSHNPFKIGQMEVELGGSVTLHCPQGEFSNRLALLSSCQVF